MRQEISLIEKACKLTDKTFEYILTKIKKGVTEKELSLEIQRFIRANGAGLSFRPLVSFGKNTAEVHHKPTDRKLKKNNIIILDFGAKIEGFCSDMTRTVFMGKATKKQKKIYSAVLKAQQKAVNFLSSDAKTIMTSEVDKVARDYIILQGYPTIPHGLGHGIGKKVHEPPKISPKSKAILKPGMVFSVEPGIYIKNFGGVRIEDLVVLEKTGPRILTKSPKRIIEL